ncbi:hypothetical protein V6N12_046379 [Hibiscus sabdariffa]|uniref:Uncharacterized protein n=1 Tax=Hibiscus sabdariffa TaxID=183260 RepID=A0ABR2DIG9_9ROSI
MPDPRVGVKWKGQGQGLGLGLEMNDIPSPRRKEKRRNEGRERGTVRSVHSGSLPPHLSNLSHSPISERIQRPGTASHWRRASSASQKPGFTDHNVGVLDSTSNANLMERLLMLEERGTGSCSRASALSPGDEALN